GVACAAVPITVGSTAAVLAVSLPAAQAERLRVTTQLLHRDVGSIMRRLRFSISI
ncbi:IclR family transcriptional regulator, partial [Streptomyces sp. NRRL F-6602]